MLDTNSAALGWGIGSHCVSIGIFFGDARQEVNSIDLNSFGLESGKKSCCVKKLFNSGACGVGLRLFVRNYGTEVTSGSRSLAQGCCCHAGLQVLIGQKPDPLAVEIYRDCNLTSRRGRAINSFTSHSQHCRRVNWHNGNPTSCQTAIIRQEAGFLVRIAP